MVWVCWSITGLGGFERGMVPHKVDGRALCTIGLRTWSGLDGSSHKWIPVGALVSWSSTLCGTGVSGGVSGLGYVYYFLISGYSSSSYV